MSDPTPMTQATVPATPRRAPTKVAKARPPTKTTARSAKAATTSRASASARRAKATARGAKAAGTKPATGATKASKRATKLPTASGAVALTQSVLPAPRTRTRRIRDAVPAAPPAVTIPVIGWTVALPGPNSIPWIAGLGIVAALEIIDWPVAMLLAVGHTVMTNSKNQQLRELAEGIESAL